MPVVLHFLTDAMTKKEMPTWEHIKTMRTGAMDDSLEGVEERKAAYFYFLEHILECITGKKEWKKDKCSCKVLDAVTVSDKAFALLLLENSWDVFQEYASRTLDKVSNILLTMCVQDENGNGIANNITAFRIFP